MQVASITLESLLDPTSDYFGDPANLPEPEEIVVECMDILEEISILEQNMVTYEAAKAIKKAKSASKKTKITKTKMKAKDAKAKKKGGKVVKITREADEAIDGGTGPLPTTSDTNGLTDTDLDADPEANVEVIEKTDDESEPTVGTEGVDFIVEYECAADLIALEADAGSTFNKIVEAVKKFFTTIGEFITKIVDKVYEVFNFNARYLKNNRGNIDTGLKNPKTVIKTEFGAKPDSLKTLLKQTKDFVDASAYLIKQINQNNTTDSIREDISKLKINKITLAGNDSDTHKFRENLLQTVCPKTNGGEFSVGDLGITSADQFDAIIGVAAAKEWRNVLSSSKKTIATALKEADEILKKKSDKIQAQFKNLRSIGSEIQKVVSISYGVYVKASSITAKIMRAAGGNAGAE
jgi:hypothetical protein